MISDFSSRTSSSPAWARLAGLAAIVVCATAHLVLAQDGGGQLDPPTPTGQTEGNTSFIAMGMAILLVAAAVGVNCIPSKRGHQD